MLLPEVRFAAHYGLKSEIALSPKSATFRTWRDVRLVSVERSEADIGQRLSTAREVPEELV